MVDVPAPDVNTYPRVMGWIFDQYSRLHGFSPGVVTRTPLDLHGCPGRNAATERGAVIASHFEWNQKMRHDSWTEERVNMELEVRMLQACRDVRSAMLASRGSALALIPPPPRRAARTPTPRPRGSTKEASRRR